MRSRRRVCQIIASQRCRQQHRYQEQWTKRTISCSLIRGVPIGKVLVPVVTEMSSTMATRVTDEVVHRGVYISRESSLPRYFISQGKSNRPMEGKNDDTQVSRV